MSIYNSELWIENIDTVISKLPELCELENKTIMITGATGLICSALVDILIRYNETHNEKIDIIVAGRSEKSVQERFNIFLDSDYFSFLLYDATDDKIVTEKKIDYIIHGASNASPNKILKEPVETMISNFIGMKALLELAKHKNTEKVIFISTSEVYGKKDNNLPFSEDEYGHIDLLNARNSYSISKSAAETLCVSYADEYGVDVSIIRPGHIYGPTATKTDNRVSSVWAYDVAEGKDIVMKSTGEQIRSYVHCLDCGSAILKVLQKGENKKAYNVSNPNSIITIKEMAHILCEAANVKLRMELPTEEEKKGFNPMSNSSLLSNSLQLLGWEGCFDAKSGFASTVKIIKETKC
ncbi:MAG: NAD(P)-dependent oxidoreductase [Mediterraneibacter faecis]|nr:NAD(P)-dependent oxidoreductase [Mediterraneibacter faecis]